METFQRKNTEHGQIKYALVPKPLLNRFIFWRAIRCVVYLALAAFMLLPLAILPGLVVLVLPAEISVISRIRDEAELVLWVRNNMIIQTSNLEDAELETEMIRLRAHNRPDALRGYLR